jgi:glycosyltransferase involved in cell wall biosynthesis
MKIAFIGNLPSGLVFPDDHLRRAYRGGGHPAPWMLALLPALGRMTNHDLRAFIVQRNIRKSCVVEREGVTYEGLPSRMLDKWNRKSLYYQKSLPVIKAVRRWKPDLIHAFGFETGNALVALRTGFPVSCFIQGIAELYEPFYGQRDWIDRKVGVWGERVAAPRVKWMVAENQFAKDWALSRNPAAHVAIIPHPTRDEFFEKGAPSFEERILTVGGLDDRKAVDVVIRAFAKVGNPDAKLVIVGGGPLRGKLESLANDLGIGRSVEFTGPLTTDDVIAQMNRARAMIIASRMDTSPNVVSEAHAIGIPVVGSRAGGIPDMIDHGEDGFLFDVDQADQAAYALTTLLAEPDRARQMGARGKEKVRLLNSSERVAKAHVEFFKRCQSELCDR